MSDDSGADRSPARPREAGGRGLRGAPASRQRVEPGPVEPHPVEPHPVEPRQAETRQAETRQADPDRPEPGRAGPAPVLAAARVAGGAGAASRDRQTPAEGLSGVGRSVQSGRGRRRPLGESITRVGLALTVAFAALAGGAGYWQVIEAEPLTTSPDNPAVVAAARTAVRGEIADRSGEWLARSERDENGDPYRIYRSNVIAPVVGYASRQFGGASLERAYDAELVGLSRPDPVSDMLKKFEGNKTDPQALALTLSLSLQAAAVEALGEDTGAVVVLRPQTGEVLALASTPLYDANAIANPATSAEAMQALQANQREPLLPRATQGLYVPGSVFKIVTALAALDSGAVEPDTVFPGQREAERDGLVVSGFRIREHAGVPVEDLTLAPATEVSSNIYYAMAGLAAGPEGLTATARELGFGERLPFDLPTAPSQLTNGGGSLPGGFKDDVELANAAYGQAETLVTPLQMALVAATVANDGVLMEPHLVASLTGANGTREVDPQQWRRVVSAEDAVAVQAAMQRAVEGELGRQFTTGADVPGVDTAGKSGTAELGGSGEPHSWFIGFAPVEDPQVAVAVLVEQGGRGAERAAPIAGQMMEATLAELAAGG